MGRQHNRNHKSSKQKAKLPQTPKTMKSDGLDAEYAKELADLQGRPSIARKKV